jgi:predicted ArsR family transcriptional regulator
MSSTQSLILAYLRRHKTATAGELARALKRTAADIRYHLDLLEAEGRVAVTGRRRVPGRGRPGRAYGLASPRPEDNLEWLVEALLALWLETEAGEEARAAKVKSLAQRMLAGEGEASSAVALSLRLKRAVEQLNRWHYQARWEASAQGPRLILEHCPYRHLATHHPALCQMDEHLLAGLTGRAVKRLARQSQDGQGERPRCIFLLPDEP